MPSASLSQRIPALDGIRGVAVLLVFAYHVGFFTGTGGAANDAGAFAALARHGWMGVDVFFVLSGFLITGILLEGRGEVGWLRRFYLRRAARIVPAYYALLLVVGGALVAARVGGSLRAGWTATWLTNVLVARDGWSALAPPLHHLWSLAVEEQFYLAWPLVVWLVPERRLGWTAALLVGASALGRVLLALHGEAVGSYVLLPARMDGLAVGALLALGVRRAGSLPAVAREMRFPALVAALILLGIARTRGTLAQGDPFMLAFGQVALVVLAGAVMIAAAAQAPTGWLRRLLDAPHLSLTGRYSYAIYLWHQPVVLLTVVTLRRHAALPPGGRAEVAVVTVLAALLTAGCAALSWHLVERPALRLRDRLPGAVLSARRAP